MSNINIFLDNRDCPINVLFSLEEALYQGKEVELNKPFRTPDGPKKFSVYVKNDNGNVVKVNFGDPDMDIQTDNPERRKAFRSRHNCSDKTDKTKPGYWSCRAWSADTVAKGLGISEKTIQESSSMKIANKDDLVWFENSWGWDLNEIVLIRQYNQDDDFVDILGVVTEVIYSIESSPLCTINIVNKCRDGGWGGQIPITLNVNRYISPMPITQEHIDFLKYLDNTSLFYVEEREDGFYKVYPFSPPQGRSSINDEPQETSLL